MDPSSAKSVVVEILRRASSQNPEILKPAEAQLREWETESGFYTTVLDVINCHEIDQNVRWMAVLCFKNGVDKYWRKSASFFNENERAALKRTLISNFREPVNQIAVQLAVLISKVARFDCPREWPELFPTLLQGIESTDSLVQHRSLLIMHHVVKAIASKRLAGDRKIFQDFTANVYSYILHLWNNFTETFLRDIGQNAPPEVITVNLEKALLTLRILRKLTVLGFNKPSQNESCMNFLKCIFSRAKESLECRKQLRGKGIYVLELCEKYIIHLTKILLNVLDNHPFSFVDLIRPTLEFTVFYIFTQEGTHYIFERFKIQCFNLIKGILLCNDYRPHKIPQLTKDPGTFKAHQIRIEVFQPNTLIEMCKKLITHYFLLKQEDLELWEADPETFVNDETGESWKYSLRPSIETVFVTIFHEYRDVLSPIVVEFIKDTNQIVDVNDIDGILRKDAIYNAACLAAYDLYDEVDFDSWFTNTLLQELKIKHTNYRVIRRRIAMLIGTWTSIKFSQDKRPLLYECIINLLGQEEDMVVRLTASTTFRHAIDDFDFNAEQFNPFLNATFNLLFMLLKEAQECESKMHVLNVMALMIERVSQTIRPHTTALIHFLPMLWQESEDYNMLRCAIVSTLVQLVKVLGSDSSELVSFLIPIIQMGTDVNQTAIIYMLEDSMELWLSVLENSSTMTNELLQLFNNIPALLDFSTENLRSCLLVIWIQLLLAPEVIMKTYGYQIIMIFDSLMSDLRAEGILLLTRVIEVIVMANPALGTETIKPLLPRIFTLLHTGTENREETMPQITAMYISILSRVLLASHVVFTEALHQAAANNNRQLEDMLLLILDAFIASVSSIVSQDRRKLAALAFTNLLTTQSRSVMERFGKIVTCIMEVLHDVMVRNDHSMLIDSTLICNVDSPSDFSEDTDSCETEHSMRKRQLILSDPVHNIDLKDYFYSQIQELKNQLGQVNYQQLLQTVPSDTLSQIGEYYFPL